MLTQEPSPPLGLLYVDLSAGSHRAKAMLVIATGSGPSLIGRDWLQKKLAQLA